MRGKGAPQGRFLWHLLLHRDVSSGTFFKTLREWGITENTEGRIVER